MRKFVLPAFLLFFAFFAPVQAQGSCVNEDLSNWTIHYGATLTAEGISSNGSMTAFSVSRSLTDVSYLVIHLTTTAPSVNVQVQQLGSGDLGYQTISSPGGTLVFENNRNPSGDFYIIPNMYSNTYPTTITAIEVCDAAPTPTSTATDTPTSTPTSTATDTPTSTPFYTPTSTPTPTLVPAPNYTPSPDQLVGMTMASLDTPYDFTPMDLATPSGGGIDDPVGAIGLGDRIADVSFLNRIGSIFATIWAIINNFGGGVFGYSVIILLAMVVIRWIASFVYGKPIHGPELEGTMAAETFVNYENGVFSNMAEINRLERERLENLRLADQMESQYGKRLFGKEAAKYKKQAASLRAKNKKIKNTSHKAFSVWRNRPRF